jgi:hypothetical protein
LRVLDPQQWPDQWTRAEPAIQGGATLLALLLCIIVASAHNLGFWRGLGGWFAGNILGSIVMLPIVIVAGSASGQDGAGGFCRLLAVCLLYAIGSALAMIWKRRRAARALSERWLLRAFD